MLAPSRPIQPPHCPVLHADGLLGVALGRPWCSVYSAVQNGCFTLFTVGAVVSALPLAPRVHADNLTPKFLHPIVAEAFSGSSYRTF